MENIFIDTSIFEENNFLESKRITTILKLAEDEHIRIVMPVITYNETIHRATARIKASLHNFREFRNKSQSLRNITSIKDRFGKIEEKECLDEFKKIFTERLTLAKCEIIKYPTINIQDVFDKYFQEEFPFGSGEKKHEFPDAFALACVEKWCLDNNKKCHVFSNDKDLLNYKSEHLVRVESYQKFLDEKLRRVEGHRRKTERVDLVTKEYNRLRHIIEDHVNAWLSSELTRESIYTQFSHLEIYDIDIISVASNLSDFQIVNITDDNILLEAPVRISFKVELEVDDDSSGWYDDEDRIWNYTERRTETVKEEQVITISLNAYALIANKNQFTIEITEINNGRDLRV